MNTLKKCCTALFISFFSISAFAQQDSILVSGSLKNLNSNSVFVSFKDENGLTKQFKTKGNGDSFAFKLPLQNIPMPARVDVGINRAFSATVNGKTATNPAPALELFVYNKPITINGDALLVQFANVKADEENNTYSRLKLITKANDEKLYSISKELFEHNYQNKTLSESENALKAQITLLNKQNKDAQRKFVASNPKSYAAVFLLARMQNLYTADDYAKAWTGLSGNFKSHPTAKTITNYIDKMSVTAAGTAATDFERHDKDGKLIRLSDFKGKTILLDFWGSWCGPCRASHPHLKELYNKYKKDGFEIIAVAQELGKTVETAKTTWLKAIAEDKINWVHVLNIENIEKQNIVKDYGVLAFPTKILIDQNGKIILRVTASATDDIDKALAKIYKH